MKQISLTLLSLAAAVVSSSAALSINVSTNPTTGAYFVLSDGTTRIPDGSLVRIGTFDVAPAANSTSIQLEAAFVEYARTTSGHTAASGANKGMINRTGIADAPAAPAETAFTGKPVYLWVYNTPAASPTSQFGVYTSTDTSWRYAASVDDPPVSVSTALINTAIGQGLTPASITPGTPNVYRLANPVPETSTFTLTALVALGLLRRKR